MKVKITLLASAGLMAACISLPMNSLAQVTKKWISKYVGPGGVADYVRTFAEDGSGNVYVTG